MFLTKDHNLLGAIDNRPSENDEDLHAGGYHLQQDSPEEDIMLDDTEMIVGIKMGLDDYSNVV